MSIAADNASESRPGIGAAVVPLLALAMFINYVDRGNLATAAPVIKDELRLSGTQIGILLSAFFWTYTPCQLLAGWLAERINPYRTLALGLGIWSLATALSGFATGFLVLIALRLLLGLGESAAFPCSSKLLAQHLPGHKLGAANGLIMMGMAYGPAFGTLMGGLLMAHYGWRPTFLLFGLASLLWLWPWLTATRDISSRSDVSLSAAAPSFIAILRVREAWGAGLGHICSNYCFYFVITWLPLYLVKARGFSVAGMAELSSLIYLVHGTSSFATGWLCDAWMRAGATANRVRKTCMVASHVGIAIAMFACALGDATISIASLFLAGACFGLNSPNVFAIGQTLAGPRAAGKWVGIQNCAGNIAGIVAPVVTGLVVDRTGEFFWAFIVSGAFAIAGIIAWGVVIRKVAPVDWRFASEHGLVSAAEAGR